MPSPAEHTSRNEAWLAVILLILATLAAFHNSLSGPFVFDDLPSIPDNPTIRQLWPPDRALFPPEGRGIPVEGRPLLNLSLAVNYAIGGVEVRGYHLANLGIHLLSALTLFGIVNRTLPRVPASAGQPVAIGHNPARVAFAVSLLWAVHPLQTESVTYVVQRAESLAGLLYLLTLYGFIRMAGAERRRATAWGLFSWTTCLLGMATKEIVVSAPLMALLYDRTFVSGSFLAAWRRRHNYYVALATTWLLLAWLVLGTAATRGGTAGLGTGVPWWRYAATQAEAVVHYLRMVFWPHPLVFDYGTQLVASPLEVIPQAALLGALLAGTLAALRRRLPSGFVGAWFFATLAPSSSVVPVATQTVAEHRMYLPLAAVVILVVVGSYRLLGRAALPASLAAALALGSVTVARNRDYSTALALFESNVAARPHNARAHYNLGAAHAQASRVPEALAAYKEALRLQPGYADVHCSIGHLLAGLGRLDEAGAHYRDALHHEPAHHEAHWGLGNLLLRRRDFPGAAARFGDALRANPDDHTARTSLAATLIFLGRWDEAAALCATVLADEPNNASAHYNLANILAARGQWGAAIARYEQALRLDLGGAQVHYNLANALANTGQVARAVLHYEETLRLQPDHVEAHYNLGNAFADLRQIDEAITHYRAAIGLQPGYAEAHHNLGSALMDSGRFAEAAGAYATALRLNPTLKSAQDNLERIRQLEQGADRARAKRSGEH